MAVKQLSDGNADGASFGQSAADKISFYGKTPVIQQALLADATDSATALTRINGIIDVLVATGLMASA